ncbi:MAG: YtxH domain-containing protein [bacterium]|nr:YtxH domain-containing protein [bacterium]
MSKNAGKKVAIGAAIGLATGFLAGILAAPKSGKETRSDIKRSATKVYSTAEKKLKKLSVELGSSIQTAKVKIGTVREDLADDITEAMYRAKKAQEKAREMISLIKNGEADEPDLDIAVNEASDALSELNSKLEK